MTTQPVTQHSSPSRGSSDQKRPMDVMVATMITGLFLGCTALFGATAWYTLAHNSSLALPILAFVPMAMGLFHTSEAWHEVFSQKRPPASSR